MYEFLKEKFSGTNVYYRSEGGICQDLSFFYKLGLYKG